MSGYGFDFNDGDGSSLAAVAADGELILSLEFGEGEYNANVCIEIPADKAVEFAKWILSRLPQQEGIK